ncbi:PhnD/SsuA/transferrin family substrate-binding protein [Nocardioides sp. QY071]|uniref:ABC transporter substrate-binding protein n=1 Tax=Nocardioides sp. QY071 TaxID=3044187 RepID=UPI00249B9D42|nr:PhnD/SsuA/transferrin family substrate-binding protein [Nocardioides sp. QY071]WGY01817.1 PhnD/SsuA/transferrin family substrate-binding protein [Nocardioides sp. QY071]
MVVAAAAALLPTACSSSESSEADASGIAKVNIAYAPGPTASWGGLYLVQSDPEMCEEYGVRPTVTGLALPAATAGLSSGNIDYVVEGSSGFLVAANNGSPTVAIASYGSLPLELYAAEGIDSLADLKGKTIVASAQGSLPDVVAHVAFDSVGLELGSDVKTVYSGTAAAAMSLFVAGKADAFVYLPPVPADLTEAGAHSIYSASGIAEIDSLSRSVVVASDRALGKTDVTTGVLKCLQAAGEMALSDSSKTVPLIAKYVSIDEESAQGQYDSLKSSYTLRPYTVDDATAVVDLLQKYGVADFEDFTPDKVINDDLIKGVG